MLPCFVVVVFFFLFFFFFFFFLLFFFVVFFFFFFYLFIFFFFILYSFKISDWTAGIFYCYVDNRGPDQHRLIWASVVLIGSKIFFFFFASDIVKLTMTLSRNVKKTSDRTSCIIFICHKSVLM